MKTYTKFTPTEIEAIAKHLQEQLSSGILTPGVLETFKFRDPGGYTWTVFPQTGVWYCFLKGRWQSVNPPNLPLDGPVDLFEMVTLPLSPLDNDKPEESEPAGPDADIRGMIEAASKRISDSYNQGRINSAEAENLLKDLYLLDPAGLIWSCGVHTGKWYTSRGLVWEAAADGPDPLDFQPGTPISEAAKQVVTRFTESGAAPLPEPVVPDWSPARGFPGMNQTNAGRPGGAQTGKRSGTSSTRRTRMIILIIFLVLFVVCACLFACGITGFLFAD